MRKAVIYLAVAVIMLAALGLWIYYERDTPPEQGYNDVQPNEVLALLGDNEDMVVLDVREQYEYAETRIPGSVLIPLQELYSGGYQELDRNGKVLVVCRSGRRSAQASEFLARQGFTSVYNLVGGMQKWPGPTEGS